MNPVRAKAVIVARERGLPHLFGAKILEGEHAGGTWVLDGYYRKGAKVTVEFYPDDQFARVLDSVEAAREIKAPPSAAIVLELPSRSCGCRRAGIMLNGETLGIERCDDCALFDDDDDAAQAVDMLLRVLGEIYDAEGEDGGTVADALSKMIDRLGLKVDPKGEIIPGSGDR